MVFNKWHRHYNSAESLYYRSVFFTVLSGKGSSEKYLSIRLYITSAGLYIILYTGTYRHVHKNLRLIDSAGYSDVLCNHRHLILYSTCNVFKSLNIAYYGFRFYRQGSRRQLNT